jgi:hypothetical protein
MVDYPKLHRLVGAITEAAESVCAVCGGNTWDTLDSLYRLSRVDETTEATVPDDGLVALAHICRDCGNVRLFSNYHLLALATKLDAEGNGHPV